VNKLRAEKYYEAKAKGYQLISYVSSKATTWPGLVIGENSFIYENTVIKPFAEIGNNVIIEAGCAIGHHTIIKDHCFLGPHTAILGEVTVEPYCVFGANSTVRETITIAIECIIGAGAVITRNTREQSVYLGKPAELLPGSSSDLSSLLERTDP
jgi:sugar O-acyltransferase (sialic acid O-acetyltransferase NeuD family)